jgi:hypothetical protein
MDYFNDYDKYIIEKKNSNKISVNITQFNDKNAIFDNVILSIFSSIKEYINGYIAKVKYVIFSFILYI